MEVCTYCGEPRREKLGCCGENHWEESHPATEEELIDLLATMFDAYEEGPDCYEDPDDCSGYLGKAVRLDDTTFHRIADILNDQRPRTAHKTPNV